MTMHDKPMTIEELSMKATEYSDNTILQAAEHLCEATGVAPEDSKIGRFLCKSLCQDNLDTTRRWLISQLGTSDALLGEIDLDQLETEFRTALYKRVPNHLLKDDQ